MPPKTTEDIEAVTTKSFHMLLKREKKNMEKVPMEELLQQLPEELLMLVLARLPWQDTLRLRRVCKLWSCILRNPQFLKLCSPSRGVPLFLSSAFSEVDMTLYYQPGVHKCFLQRGFCNDYDFQLFSPQGDKWSIFPRTWFNFFLHETLSRTRTRCIRLVAVKGGIFLIFFRRQNRTTNSGALPFAAEAAATEERCGWAKLQILSKQNSEIVYLVNPFTQSCRLLNLPSHLEAKGFSLYWVKIKKMIVDKQSNTFTILLGPSVQKCDKHERCDIWLLDCYDVNENSWSNSFSFHLCRAVPITGEIQQSVDAGWLYDATTLGEKLFIITCHSDSLFGVWEFSSNSRSIFPTRLADVPALSVYKPSLHVSLGRLMILGQSFNMDEFDFSFCIWEYDPLGSQWIPLVSIFSEPKVACWNLKGDFGQGLACISIVSARTSEYFVCDLQSRIYQKLPATAHGRKLFMIEPRLDMHL
ncbi:hypothetical protein R1flu_026888 [Riccia fluitans]|uniref:F-box domain-containing protein n=1 Tax=Riccia fluitans TaxID=41844 RepID=A0ABD1XH75_9MARC